MNQITITEEIRSDHQRLIATLDQLIAREKTPERFSKLKRCLTQLGAHHLAEEESILQAMKCCQHDELGEIQAFHEVLDNLADTISFGGPKSETLEHELRVLRHLISLLSDAEETKVLTMAEWELSLPKRVELASNYRTKCDEYLRDLA